MNIYQESDPFYKPPTHSEIAEKGCAEFASLLSQFSRNARQLFIGSATTKPHYIKFMDVWRCAVGVSPEIAFEDYILAAFPQEAFEEAAQIINTQARYFFFYRRERAPQFYHLFNLLAVRQVALNYPEYFPLEVATDTKAWLERNWQLWADGNGTNCIRYGLLSGFPLEAAQAFSASKATDGKHPVRSVVTYLSYFGVNAEKDSAYIRQLDEVFSGMSSIKATDFLREKVLKHRKTSA